MFETLTVKTMPTRTLRLRSLSCRLFITLSRFVVSFLHDQATFVLARSLRRTGRCDYPISAKIEPGLSAFCKSCNLAPYFKNACPPDVDFNRRTVDGTPSRRRAV